MKRALIIFLTLFFSSCSSDDDLIIELSEYDLDVISYFKEIALGFEFGSSSELTRKWCSEMKIFIGGDTNPNLLNELNKIIGEIEDLSTDDFSIEIVSDSAKSNYYLYFGKGEDYANLFPSQSSYVNSNWGLFSIWWNSVNCLNRGHMYVDIYRADDKGQKHLLREELTQSLGLAKDSNKYQNSIFQSSWTTTTSFSQIDKDVIRLLYHPEMQNGLKEFEVDVLLRSILLSEK
tara:strand:- start:3725 stop:4423 length:699 start_codon:yes stop_codon:yes gene_type:complete